MGFLLSRTTINPADVKKCGTRGMLPNTQLGSHGCQVSRKSSVFWHHGHGVVWAFEGHEWPSTMWMHVGVVGEAPLWMHRSEASNGVSGWHHVQLFEYSFRESRLYSRQMHAVGWWHLAAHGCREEECLRNIEVTWRPRVRSM